MNITRCKFEHLKQLKQIFKRVYPSNPRLQNDTFLKWQFKDNPYNQDEDYCLWLIEESFKIKGFYGWIPIELLLNDIICGSEPILWWTESGSKGYGLNLLGQIVDQFPINLFHGCNHRSTEIFSTFGFQVFPLKRYIAIVDFKAIEQLLKMSPPLSLVEKNNYFLEIINETALNNVYLLNNFDTCEEMTFTSFQSIKAHLKYTSKYLNWRYVNIPESTYKIIRGAKDGEYCIYRLERIMGHDFFTLRIIEWSFGNETANDAFSFLLKDALENNVILMDFFCSSDEIGNLFNQKGFGTSTEIFYNEIPYLFRPLKKIYDLLITGIYSSQYIQDSKWYISKGNSDLDRVKL